MQTMEKVRSLIQKAMKNGTNDRDILRVYFSKLQQIEVDEGKITEERCVAVARSIIKNNKEAVESMNGKSLPIGWKEKLDFENKIMEGFLPTYLTKEEVISNLIEVKDKIISANNDGAGVGIAMKHLKSKNLLIEGNTVKIVVEEMRRK